MMKDKAMTIPSKLCHDIMTEPGLDLQGLLDEDNTPFFEDLDFHLELGKHFGKTPYYFNAVSLNCIDTFGGAIILDKDRLVHLFCLYFRPDPKLLIHAISTLPAINKYHVRMAYNDGWVEALVSREKVCYVRKLGPGKYMACRYNAAKDVRYTSYGGVSLGAVNAYAEEYEAPIRNLVAQRYLYIQGDPFGEVRKRVFENNVVLGPDKLPFKFIDGPWNAVHTVIFSPVNCLFNASGSGVPQEPKEAAKKRIDKFKKLSADIYLDAMDAVFVEDKDQPTFIEKDGEILGVSVKSLPATQAPANLIAVEFNKESPTLAEALLSYIALNSTVENISSPPALIFDRDNYLVNDFTTPAIQFHGKYRGLSCRAKFQCDKNIDFQLSIVNCRGDMHLIDCGISGYQEYIWDATTCDLSTTGSHGSNFIISMDLMKWSRRALCLSGVPQIS